MNVLTQAGTFLIQIIFDIYLFILMLRILMQMTKVNYYNPINQIIVRLTDPLFLVIYKLIPKRIILPIMGFIVIIILEMIKITLLQLVMGVLPNFLGVLVWSTGEFLSQLFNLYFYLIILQAVISWFVPSFNAPIYEALSKLTEPLLRPFRKIIPPIAGLDISPVIALIILQLIAILAIYPFVEYGMRLCSV